MAVHPDGTHDCPRCVHELGRHASTFPPARRVSGLVSAVCPECEHAIHCEALAGIGQLDVWRWPQQRVTDWKIEHGLNPLDTDADVDGLAA